VWEDLAMSTEIANIRKLNFYAGMLHLVSLIAVVTLANGTSLPVVATYMSDAPGTGNYAAPVNLFDLRISVVIALFLGLSAFFHFLIISPMFYDKYVKGLNEHHNTFRWVEYSLSSSIMIVVILQLNGVTDYIALAGMFAVNMSMILFGWLQERYGKPGNGDMVPFIFGCIAGAVPWIIIAINALSIKGPKESTTPGFVYGIIVSLFILFNCFALVQWKQYKAQGKWANYLYGERRYVVLSLVAKSALAWQIFAGALAASGS
jgi:hypothetical protein